MDEFKKVIEQLTSLFKQLTKIENVKLNAVAGKHIGTVEDCVTQQQALLLKLRGLEQARERAQKKAGYEGLQFRQILEQAPDDEREELFRLFDGLSREIQMFREINDSSNEILRTNLHSIDKALRAKAGSTYNGEGKSEMGEGWLLTAEMLELADKGVDNIVCTQPFGCLPNHICGKGMMKPLKEKNPDINIVAIDYDAGATRVNQENRLKLMLANAKQRKAEAVERAPEAPGVLRADRVG